MRRIRTTNVRASFVLLLTCLLSSCTELDLDEVAPGPCEVGMYAGGVQTRTEMLSDGLSAMWSPDDEIAVWAKSSSGSYAFSNKTFKTYGVNEGLGYFTAVLDSPMSAGYYTYFCCYPVPSSLNGTVATFDIPAIQDGKVTGGADIMIATPVSHGALSPVPDPEDHSGMSMEMNRMLHQFRFWIPKGTNVLGTDVEKIEITMPQNIAGTVSADVSNPSSGVSMSNGVKTITLELAEPLGESSDFEHAAFACASVFPHKGTYTASDYMNLVVYSKSGRATLEPISLAGRTFAAGHSTPVRLITTKADEYYRLTMNIGDNYIGEPLRSVTVYCDDFQYTYTNTSAEGNGNFTHQVEALGNEGKTCYDQIIAAVKNGTATYAYETEHALVNRAITTDMLTYDGNRIVLALGDVPYLLYEDFSGAKNYASSKGDAYNATTDSDTNNDGYLLDGYLPNAGWNASRFGLMEGDCIRINCRLEGWGATFSRYCGRLDTPALKWIKPGVTAKVRLEFDRAFVVPAGYNMDDSSNPHARYKIGHHTKGEGSAIDGVNSNSVNSAATIVKTSGLYASENPANMTTESLTMDVTNSTRIAFFVDTDRTKADKFNILGANSCYYLYLDNIKVYFE